VEAKLAYPCFVAPAGSFAGVGMKFLAGDFAFVVIAIGSLGRDSVNAIHRLPKEDVLLPRRFTGELRFRARAAHPCESASQSPAVASHRGVYLRW
jgi:hypothetical protein